MAGLLTSKCHFLSIDESRQRGKSNWVAVDNLTHGPTEKEMYLSKNVRVQDGALILATVKEKHEDSSGKVHTHSLPLPLSHTLSHSLSRQVYKHAIHSNVAVALVVAGLQLYVWMG